MKSVNLEQILDLMSEHIQFKIVSSVGVTEGLLHRETTNF
jgi:hypothetical protein